MSVDVTRRGFLAASTSLLLLPPHTALAQASRPLRIAISLIDVPRMWGGPDGGFEGMRFGGYTVFDALYIWDLSQAERPCDLVPGLAVEGRHDEVDPTRFVVTLREGVRFHDGTPFDADAAVWNFAAVFDDTAPHFLAGRAAGIRARLPTVVGASKIDARTIAVHTSVPDSSVPYQLSFLLFSSPTRFEEEGRDWNAFAERPAGTGPFSVGRIAPRTLLALDANADYWDAARRPRAPGLELYPIPDANARVAALRARQVDIIESVPPETIGSLEGAGFVVTSNVYPHTWNWGFSHQPGSPYADVRVRRAANLAIDRAGLVELLNGTAVPAEGLVPESSAWFGAPTFVPRHDPEEARRLMAEAGYGPDNRVTTKTLIANAGGGQMQPLLMNDYIRENLAEIWIDVAFEVVDFITLFTAWRNGAAAPAMEGVHAINLASPVQEPNTAFLRGFQRDLMGRGGNWGGYGDDDVEALIAEARATFETEAFNAVLQRLHERLVDDAVNLMVVHDTNPRAMSSGVTGFVHPKNWFADFTGVVVG